MGTNVETVVVERSFIPGKARSSVHDSLVCSDIGNRLNTEIMAKKRGEK